MGELSKLPNIGKTVEEQLNQVGINSVDELKSTGAKEAWLKIQKIEKKLIANFERRKIECTTKSIRT